MLAEYNRQSNRQSNHSDPDGSDGDGKAKKAKNRTLIGDWVPGPTEKQAAVTFWGARGRSDLIANLEDIAQHFAAHHSAVGTRMLSWPNAWKTWYVNQINRVRPPRDMPAGPKLAASAGVTIEQWIYRWRCWCLGIPDEGIYGEERPKGFWDKAWGPKPGQKGFDAPLEAWAEFKKRFPNAA